MFLSFVLLWHARCLDKIFKVMSREPRKGDMILLRSGEKCLVLQVHDVDGLGSFFEVMLSTGECIMLDITDILKVL